MAYTRGILPALGRKKRDGPALPRNRKKDNICVARWLNGATEMHIIRSSKSPASNASRKRLVTLPRGYPQEPILGQHANYAQLRVEAGKKHQTTGQKQEGWKGGRASAWDVASQKSGGGPMATLDMGEKKKSKIDQEDQNENT